MRRVGWYMNQDMLMAGGETRDGCTPMTDTNAHRLPHKRRYNAGSNTIRIIQLTCPSVNFCSASMRSCQFACSNSYLQILCVSKFHRGNSHACTSMRSFQFPCSNSYLQILCVSKFHRGNSHACTSPPPKGSSTMQITCAHLIFKIVTNVSHVT